MVLATLATFATLPLFKKVASKKRKKVASKKAKNLTQTLPNYFS
jgi:hypothetical protein